MRKLAPVFFSSIVLLASGSALALGDMHKNKNAPTTKGSTTSQTYSGSSSGYGGGTSSSSDTSATSGTSGASGGASKSTGLDNATSNMSSSGLSHENASGTPAQTRSGRKSSPSAAQDKNIGDRCDKSKHPTLPADCEMTGARQGNATGSTQGASGGSSGGAASGSAGASASAAGGPGH